MNLHKTKSSIAALCIILSTMHTMIAQTTKILTLNQVYEIAIANSKQLKLSQTGIEMAQAATNLARTALLPTLDASLSAFYIGNGMITDRDFTNVKNIEMPHFGNNFGIEASQVIFAGGEIASNIKKAKLEVQVAQLNQYRSELDICFLVTAYYLDLYKLKNQREVFLKNMEQTELLIQQIKSKEKQGMALSSDVTRHELMLQNLKLELIEVDNNNQIINNQLVTTLGLPSETIIIPDSSVLNLNMSAVSEEKLLQLASEYLPELKTASLNKEIVARELQIAKADYYPHIMAVAANNFNGPILIEIPTINNNFNYWYVGVGIKYCLASLYKTRRNIQLANKKLLIAEYTETLTLENTQLAVKTAYIKFKESQEKLTVHEYNSRLASENYRIINNRYLSNLVLITEMLDASNTKLNAELQLVNAKLNVIYNYYKMQREIGMKLKN
ncbi:MAG: TolC family protein [Bacteroidetes bacterium]|nr:TolC family protein [Bacteroidota bacterium]